MRGTHGSAKTEAMLRQHHNHEVSGSQCSSSLTQTIDAPMGLVWSMVRDFGHPQAYKRFVRRCIMRLGNGGGGGDVGSVREVHVVSGMPAGVSVERLERLDDDAKVMSFSIIGGDHRLENYRSTTSVHEDEDDHDDDEGEVWKRTVVIESYVVDVPEGSSEEDTCAFANTIIRCNLISLTTIAEKMAAGS